MKQRFRTFHAFPLPTMSKQWENQWSLEIPSGDLDFRFSLQKLCPSCSFLLILNKNQQLFMYRQWTHVRTYGTYVFAMDMLSSIFQASGDKLMKPMAFYCVFILVLRRLLQDF